MKKIVFLAIVLALGSIFSQQVTAQDMKIGATADASFSWFGGDVESNGSRFGIGATFFTSILLTEKLALRPEVSFRQYGGRIKYTLGDTVNDKFTEKLNYIVVPIMLDYYVTEEFAFQFGPYLGFLVKAKREVPSALGKYIGESANIEKEYKKNDFGLGLGFSYMNANTVFGFRANFGLTDVNDLTGKDSRTNVALVLSIGYKFVDTREK